MVEHRRWLRTEWRAFNLRHLWAATCRSGPSYYALEELIMHEWRTNETIQTDRNGNIAFRGFKGKYLLTWTDKKGEHSMEYYVE